MKVEELLQLYGKQLSVVEHRYGCGYVVCVEGIDDDSILDSVNDMNGESQWELYGLWTDDSWFPVASGSTVVEAIENLGKKIASWTDADLNAVGYAISILSQTKKLPAYFLVSRPKTMADLHEFLEKWNADEYKDEDILITVKG